MEQWKGSKWIPILHLDSYQSLNKAIAALEKLDQPGLYRVLQTQRCIWAERERGTVRLHRSHVSSPKSLANLVKIYKREGGRRPVEKARQERARVKANRARK